MTKTTSIKCKVCKKTAMFKGRTETGAASELVFGFCSKECYEWFDTNQLPMEGLLVLIQGNIKGV